METSKKIIFASYTCAILITIITVILAFLDKDIIAMATITGLAWGEVTASNAFYFAKAKQENTIKITADFVNKMRNKINADADLASIINSIK